MNFNIASTIAYFLHYAKKLNNPDFLFYLYQILQITIPFKHPIFPQKGL